MTRSEREDTIAPRSLLPGLTVLRDQVDSKYGSRPTRWGEAAALIKRAEPEHPSMIVNEFMAKRLAIALGVPVPLGEVAVFENGDLAWVSALAGRSSIDMPPASVAFQRRISKKLMARLLVFDSWINNSDRTDENLIPDSRGSYWAIDHEQAFFGDHPVRAESVQAIARAPVMRHLDETAITVTEDLLDAESKKVHLDGPAIAAVYREEAKLRNLASTEAIDRMYDLLKQRSGNIRTLLQADYARSGGRGDKAWGQPHIT